jgi:uncharacterized protein YjbJ (UPF0337 family)
MSGVETATDVARHTIEEIKQQIDGLAESTIAPIESAALDLQENAQSSVGQVKDVIASTLDTLVQSGSADQMRGYANEAIGRTKLAIALAAQSPELAMAGLAQQAIGELQKFVGEAKRAADPEE